MGEEGWMIDTAIPEAVEAMIHLETEWDKEKMEKKIKEYFKKAAKHMEFKGKPLQALINDFAENALSSIFAGLGDREWLNQGQADFVLVLDAAIKDYFPAKMLQKVDQLSFEQMVLSAYETAFEEQRFGPLLTEAVPTIVSGPKTKKKVWNSVEQGRKDAVASGVETAEEFLVAWINASIQHLSAASFGSPADTMEQELCQNLFNALLEAGAMPMKFAEEEAPVHAIEGAVQEAYTQHTGDPDSWEAAAPPAKKAKVGGLLYGGGMGAAAFPASRAAAGKGVAGGKGLITPPVTAGKGIITRPLGAAKGAAGKGAGGSIFPPAATGGLKGKSKGW